MCERARGGDGVQLKGACNRAGALQLPMKRGKGGTGPEPKGHCLAIARCDGKAPPGQGKALSLKVEVFAGTPAPLVGPRAP